ncbi:VOC family protein [Phenylobacterium sp.]|uniref:VOC family protein n=1 Tax=Phenylobacterium sp. TaxID=1871053 RepID=UPI0035B30514
MSPPAPSVFGLKGLDHVVLRVEDARAVIDFYVQVVGCAVEKVQADVGLFQLRAGRSIIDIIPIDGKLGRVGGAPPGAEGRNLDHFALAVEPFNEAAIRAHLAAHGVEVEESGRRYGAEGYGPSIYIRDPAGNVVELKGPSGPSPA